MLNIHPKPIFKCVILVLCLSLQNCNTKAKTPKINLDTLYPSADLKIKDHNDWAVKHYPKRIQQFKETPLELGDIVFIGNSLTEGGGNWSEKLNLPNIKNRGISGDNTNGILHRLKEITHYKPKIVFLLIGINDLNDKHQLNKTPDAKYVGNNIIKIAKTLHKELPETKVYVQTLLPALDNLLMPHIKTVNTIIKSNEDKTKYEVIDLHTAFVDTNNTVNPDLFRDYLHLNEVGYDVWVETLKPFLNSYKL